AHRRQRAARGRRPLSRPRGRSRPGAHPRHRKRRRGRDPGVHRHHGAGPPKLAAVIELRAPLPGDFAEIGAAAAETWVRESAQGGYDLAPLLASPWTKVGLIGGRPVAAGGLVDQGYGVAVAWALV